MAAVRYLTREDGDGKNSPQCAAIKIYEHDFQYKLTGKDLCFNSAKIFLCIYVDVWPLSPTKIYMHKLSNVHTHTHVHSMELLSSRSATRTFFPTFHRIPLHLFSIIMLYITEGRDSGTSLKIQSLNCPGQDLTSPHGSKMCNDFCSL